MKTKVDDFVFAENFHLKIHFIDFFFFLSSPSITRCRESANSRSTSSTDRRSTLPTDDLGSCEDSLPSRSFSDDAQPQPLQSAGGQQQPGANLLSQTEIKLCNSLNMPATRFITLKTVLLSGGGDHSYAIKPEQAGTTTTTATGAQGGSQSHIDSIKRYLNKAGWLAGGH